MTSSNTQYAELIERLGFHIEERGGISCVVEAEGGVHPASLTELAMWSELTALERLSSDREMMRAEAFEEAAKVAEETAFAWGEVGSSSGYAAAAAIRARSHLMEKGE